MRFNCEFCMPVRLVKLRFLHPGKLPMLSERQREREGNLGSPFVMSMGFDKLSNEGVLLAVCELALRP